MTFLRFASGAPRTPAEQQLAKSLPAEIVVSTALTRSVRIVVWCLASRHMRHKSYQTTQKLYINPTSHMQDAVADMPVLDVLKKEEAQQEDKKGASKAR